MSTNSSLYAKELFFFLISYYEIMPAKLSVEKNIRMQKMERSDEPNCAVLLLSSSGLGLTKIHALGLQ